MENNGRISKPRNYAIDYMKFISAVFVIIAEDASANTRKRIQDKCTYYHVPFAVCGTQDVLGQKIGKESRSCVAVTDANFGRQLAKGFGIEI